MQVRPRAPRFVGASLFFSPPRASEAVDGPLVYELGRLSFKQENGVRLPGGLPILVPGRSQLATRCSRLRHGLRKSTADGRIFNPEMEVRILPEALPHFPRRSTARRPVS